MKITLKVFFEIIVFNKYKIFKKHGKQVYESMYVMACHGVMLLDEHGNPFDDTENQLIQIVSNSIKNEESVGSVKYAKYLGNKKSLKGYKIINFLCNVKITGYAQKQENCKSCR